MSKIIESDQMISMFGAIDEQEKHGTHTIDIVRAEYLSATKTTWKESNGQYLHGYETQIEEYGKAERTRNLIYVFVDIGNPGRRKALIELHDYTAQSGTPCPDLVIIDAQSKKAASTYTTGSELRNQEDVALLDWDKSFEELEKILSELPEIDLKEFPSIGTDELGFSI